MCVCNRFVSHLPGVFWIVRKTRVGWHRVSFDRRCALFRFARRSFLSYRDKTESQRFAREGYFHSSPNNPHKQETFRIFFSAKVFQQSRYFTFACYATASVGVTAVDLFRCRKPLEAKALRLVVRITSLHRSYTSVERGVSRGT